MFCSYTHLGRGGGSENMFCCGCVCTWWQDDHILLTHIRDRMRSRYSYTSATEHILSVADDVCTEQAVPRLSCWIYTHICARTCSHYSHASATEHILSVTSHTEWNVERFTHICDRTCSQYAYASATEHILSVTNHTEWIVVRFTPCEVNIICNRQCVNLLQCADLLQCVNLSQCDIHWNTLIYYTYIYINAGFTCYALHFIKVSSSAAAISMYTYTHVFIICTEISLYIIHPCILILDIRAIH